MALDKHLHSKIVILKLFFRINSKSLKEDLHSKIVILKQR